MKRRLGKLLEYGLIAGVLVLELVIGKLPDAPEWFGTPLYYAFVFGVLLIGLSIFWVWADTGEMSEIDELEERMEQLFDKQTKAIDRLTKEIRKERKMWYARFKQGNNL
jgi:hypothetical protein